MTRFASERKALGVCDICGLWGPRLRKLKWDGDTESQTARVHDECYDQLNPSIVLGRRRYDDAIALRDPRPRYVSVPVYSIWDNGDATWDSFPVSEWDGLANAQAEIAS